MEEADRKRFADVLSALAEAFGRKPTKAFMEAYWQALKDLPVDAVERAGLAALRDCKFMPTPAEIRERSGQIPLAVVAAEQWERVIGRFRGKRRGIVDVVAERVVRLIGGHGVIGDRSPEENDTWTRKEFLRLYEEVASSPAAMESLGCGDAVDAGTQALIDGLDAKLSAEDRTQRVIDATGDFLERHA